MFVQGVNIVSRKYIQYLCRCELLTVHAESILHMVHTSFSTVSILGDFDVINFRDVITEDALENSTIILHLNLTQ